MNDASSIAQTTPLQTTPAQTTPAQTAHGQTAHSQTAHSQTAPGQTAPGRTTLGQAAFGETTTAWRHATGLTPYPAALAAMQDHAAAIRAGTAGDLVWLVEHPPLYTAGTSARPEHLHEPGRFPTYAAGRGGQWTYHGPGQRIAYVMLDLTVPHGSVPPRDVRAYVHGLEAWLIRTLARFGVAGERRDGRVGIWVVDPIAGTEAKIAAIGVRVSRWVSWHGVALNVAPDLRHFGGIVPCGISAHGVTSLAALGVPTSLPAVDGALRDTWNEVFGG